MCKINFLIVLMISTHIINIKCGIADFLFLKEDDDTPLQKSNGEKDCLCQDNEADGRNCLCCLELNLTSELSRACVRVKYLSQSEGVSMNLTLGKILSKASVVKVEKPEEPVCLSFFVGLAKMCAKFDRLTPSVNSGLIGCLKMQPKIFGEVPVDFDFPCFDMNSGGIQIIEASKQIELKKDVNVTASLNESGSYDHEIENILNIVSRTADQGIKIIYDFFGQEQESEIPPETEIEVKKE